MNLKNLVLVILSSLAALWARPKTDVIVMRNGDHLTCEIKKLERGVLYAGFDYIDGTIPIDWAKVAHVESDDELLTEEGGLQTEPVARNDVRAQVGDCADDETDHDRMLIRYRVPVPLVRRSFRSDIHF